MAYRHTIGSLIHDFSDLNELLAKASAGRAGDRQAGLLASSTVERSAARRCLADLPLRRFLEEPLIPGERDAVTRLVLATHDAQAFARVSHLSVGDFRQWLLRESTTAATLGALAAGITPEMAAAVSKLMHEEELASVAARCCILTRGRTTLGLPGHLGIRLAVRSPPSGAPHLAGEILEGLLSEAGDALIDIRPMGEDPLPLEALWRALDTLLSGCGIPTQACIRAPLRDQLAALERGVPVDLLWQTAGGCEQTNRRLGVDLDRLADACTSAQSTVFEIACEADEPGAAAVHGVDAQTREARACGVARTCSPLLVTVAARMEDRRAALEALFCGRLMGLPLACDWPVTPGDPALDTMIGAIAAGGLSVAPTRQVDARALRVALGLRPAPEFEAWLTQLADAQEGDGRSAWIRRLLARHDA